MKRWFLPYTPDLARAAARAVARSRAAGIDAFVAVVGRRRASRTRRCASSSTRPTRRAASVLKELRAAFSTPVRPRGHLRAVGAARRGAQRREEHGAGVRDHRSSPPDPAMAEMAGHLLGPACSTSTTRSSALQARTRTQATDEADAAIKCEPQPRALLPARDVGPHRRGRPQGASTGRRELYRRYSRIGESLVRVASPGLVLGGQGGVGVPLAPIRGLCVYCSQVEQSAEALGHAGSAGGGTRGEAETRALRVRRVRGRAPRGLGTKGAHRAGPRRPDRGLQHVILVDGREIHRCTVDRPVGAQRP